jgi:hypothetical protein
MQRNLANPGVASMPVSAETSRRLLAALRRLPSDPAALADAFRPDAPLHAAAGGGAPPEAFGAPLRHARPDAERRDWMWITGPHEGGDFVGALGVWQGSFERPLFGVAPSRRPATLRFGEFHRIDGDMIAESWLLVDLPDLAWQSGLRVGPPAMGTEGAWQPPRTLDALRLGGRDAAEGDATLALARAMGAGLGQYDGRTLESMGQERFWTPDFMWYGPGGIGSTRGLRGFQRDHQIPFLAAFPDRRGGNHAARFGDGLFCGWVGWPSVRATHAGGGFLGLPPTGRPVGMRVMDFYRRAGDRLAENWVFIDLYDLMGQMGFDPFDRLDFEARRR